MERKITSVQWVSETGNSLFRITDDEGNSTVIDAERMAELMSEMAREGKTEVLARYFTK